MTDKELWRQMEQLVSEKQSLELKCYNLGFQVHGYRLQTSSHSVLQWHNRSYGFDNHHARDRRH